MKQGTAFIKIIFAVVFLALMVYLVFAAVSAMRSSITTVTALTYEVGDGLSTTGFVVRDEQPIQSDYPINMLTRAEGEKVTKGMELAVSYQNEQAQQLQNEISDIEAKIAQLQAVYDAGLSGTDNGSLDRTILSHLIQSAVYTARGSVTSVQTVSPELKSEIVRRYIDTDDYTALSSQISELNQQLNEKKSQVSAGSAVICADRSGYFSGSVDGYETLLSSEVISQMDVAQFDQMLAREAHTESNQIGKLITSPMWYYVTCIDAEQAERYRVGQQLNVTFAYDFYSELKMRVDRISDPSDGRRLVVLSSENYLWEASGLRMQTADLVVSTYSGLRVPKSAIYYSDEDQSAGVYVLEGDRALWKDVTLLFEIGEYCIVEEDKSSISNLWPGDEIIVTTQELYDGKVVS